MGARPIACKGGNSLPRVGAGEERTRGGDACIALGGRTLPRPGRCKHRLPASSLTDSFFDHVGSARLAKKERRGSKRANALGGMGTFERKEKRSKPEIVLISRTKLQLKGRRSP